MALVELQVAELEQARCTEHTYPVLVQEFFAIRLQEAPTFRSKILPQQLGPLQLPLLVHFLRTQTSLIRTYPTCSSLLVFELLLRRGDDSHSR